MVCYNHEVIYLPNAEACPAHSGVIAATGPACVGHDATPGPPQVCTGHTPSTCPTHTPDTFCTNHVPLVYVGDPTLWTDPILSISKKIKATHFNELYLAIHAELVKREKSWPSNPGAVNVNDKSTYLDIRKLRDAINTCLPWTWPASMDNTNLYTDDLVGKTQYEAMRSRVNDLETTCACNCDYSCTCVCAYCTCVTNSSCTCVCAYGCTCVCAYGCTCNCAYACTCNCAYSCTCNCDYCPCNCNYGCTCNCNYGSVGVVACTCNVDYSPGDLTPDNPNDWTCTNHSDKRLKKDIIYM